VGKKDRGNVGVGRRERIYPSSREKPVIQEINTEKERKEGTRGKGTFHEEEFPDAARRPTARKKDQNGEGYQTGGSEGTEGLWKKMSISEGEEGRGFKRTTKKEGVPTRRDRKGGTWENLPKKKREGIGKKGYSWRK